MRSFLTFLSVLAFNSIFLWALYVATSSGFTEFKVHPSGGDLKAVYLPLTTFGYVAQVVASVFLFVLLNWQVSKAFDAPHPIKTLLHDTRFYWFYFLMIFCVFVFANKIDWTLRLVFGGDRYGYYTTRPATTSFIIALSCLGLMFVSLWQTNGWPMAKRVTAASTVITFALAALAATHVISTVV